eukprot:COSAG06_NODE_860_length_11903_cov_3.097170_9_plen_103_part_00
MYEKIVRTTVDLGRVAVVALGCGRFWITGTVIDGNLLHDGGVYSKNYLGGSIFLAKQAEAYVVQPHLRMFLARLVADAAMLFVQDRERKRNMEYTTLLSDTK